MLSEGDRLGGSHGGGGDWTGRGWGAITCLRDPGPEHCGWEGHPGLWTLARHRPGLEQDRVRAELEAHGGLRGGHPVSGGARGPGQAAGGRDGVGQARPAHSARVGRGARWAQFIPDLQLWLRGAGPKLICWPWGSSVGLSPVCRGL